MDANTQAMLAGAAGAAAASLGYAKLNLTDTRTIVYVAGGAALPYLLTTYGPSQLPQMFTSSPNIAYAVSGALLAAVTYKLVGSSM